MGKSKSTEEIKHPCFHPENHSRYEKIHLPVSPKCNIQCRFCRRSLNKKEGRSKRDGVLTPEQALVTLQQAKKHSPQLTVVGIAGPGDALATDHALQTFRLIHEQHPGLIKCLSTNGLLLKEKAASLAETGVKTVTVTVNSLALKTVAQLCSYVLYKEQYFTGEYAARWLVTAQLFGIAESVKQGMKVRINTILIPGVNDGEIGEIARLTADAGASLINIVPLVPQFDFNEYRAPTCNELNKARAAAEQYLPAFRHCHTCHADTCGSQNGDIVIKCP